MYRIGYISTDLFFGIQNLLLEEGNILYVWWQSDSKDTLDSFKFKERYGDKFVPCPNMPMKDFAKLVDFAFVDGFNGLPKDYMDLKNSNVPTIGTDTDLEEIELDRAYGKALAKYCGLSLPPNGASFSNIPDALTYLDTLSCDNVLLKGESNTIFPTCLEEAKNILREDPQFVLEKSIDTRHKEELFIESEIKGEEIAFGGWWNGKSFDDLFILTQEYKGANNNNRGKILTGEVGTAFSIVNRKQLPPRMQHAFDCMKDYLVKTGSKYLGFIDFNTILVKDGIRYEPYFLEFTTRPGYPTELEWGYFAHHKFDKGYGGWLAHLTGFSKQPFGYCSQEPYYGCAVGIFAHGLGLSEEPKLKYVPKLYNLPHLKGETYLIPFCSYIDNGVYVMTEWERFAFVTSYANKMEECISIAYDNLKGIDVWGHTCRDDVGSKFARAKEAMLLMNDYAEDPKKVSYSVKFLEKEDIYYLSLIDKLSFDENEYYDEDTFISLLGNRLYLACAENKIVGYLLEDKNEHSTPIMYLVSMAVDENFRNKGVAKTLLGFAKKSNPKLYFSCKKELKPFYEKQGFKFYKDSREEGKIDMSWSQH
jgi:phosphoribosylamine-glycine ligase/GNAT superfamily N-acetyltransferase